MGTPFVETHVARRDRPPSSRWPGKLIPAPIGILNSFEALAARRDRPPSTPEPGLVPALSGAFDSEIHGARRDRPPGAPGPGFLPVFPGVLVCEKTLVSRRDRPPSPVSSIPISATQSLETVLSELLPLQSSGKHSLRLSDIFPSLANLSFDQIVSKSTIYLKAAALSRASADALLQHDIDPDSVTVDPNIIAEHSLIANQQGLPSLLRHLFNNLETNTLQPLCPADSAIIEASILGATAL